MNISFSSLAARAAIILFWLAIIIGFLFLPLLYRMGASQ